MGATSRFALPYQDLGDAPDGPVLGKNLAETVESRLSRLYRCTSTTRPPGVPTDFLAWEEDTGQAIRFDGTTWQVFAAGLGGGGGSGAVGTTWAGWQASSAQPLATGTDVTIAFGTALGGSDASVTRATSGAGHIFTLTQTRAWTISTTVRFAQQSTGGRLLYLVTGSGAVLAKAGADAPVNTPWTAVLAKGRRLAAGTTIKVVGRHNAGSSLSLDPEGGDSVSIDFLGV